MVKGGERAKVQSIILAITNTYMERKNYFEGGSSSNLNPGDICMILNDMRESNQRTAQDKLTVISP